MKAEFASHLDKHTQRVQKFSNDVANELAIYDDLMMAGENLANKAHDMDAVRRYVGLESQLEEKIVDERFESNFAVTSAYLVNGMGINSLLKYCHF